MNKRLALVVLLVVSVFAACGKAETKPASSGDPTTTTTEAAPTTETTDASAAPAAVGVTATEYAYEFGDGATTLTAGEIDLTLTNDGEEEHHLTIAQLKEGKTFDDLVAVGENPSTLPSVVDLYGGPNGVAPGESVTATVSLAAGEYLFLCVIPAADGEPHAVKGMLANVTVEGDAEVEQPTADRTIPLSDYEFGFGDDALLEAGDYAITNEGPQAHELTMYTPAEGSTTEDVLDYFGDPANAEPGAAPPPMVPAGGVAAMNVGVTNVVTLTPGEYIFICFIPDVADGAPHFAHGMIHAVSVE